MKYDGHYRRGMYLLLAYADRDDIVQIAEGTQ